MELTITYRKKIAFGLLFLMIINLLLAPACFALTSGPSQPEARAFQPAGVSDMVDLFTGDFAYNIPLLDVDGYPINLNYESGTGMDDEASWTGLGWNVNVGAINRQVRGIPDDMSGDTIETDHYTKPKVTVGGRLSAKVEIFGHGKGVGPKLNGTLSVGVFNDNYTGIGAEVGANAGLTGLNDGPFTAGLGLGITSNTTSGVDITPSLNLGISEGMSGKGTVNAGLSASLGYNSRSGLKNLTLGSSFSVSKQMNTKNKQYDLTVGTSSIGNSFISYNTEPILPAIQVPYRSTYGSFSVDVGSTGWGIFGGFGGTGYKSVREVASPKLINPSYGFLYAERGKNQKNATMDFIREKDNPVIPESPNLAIPVHTPDLFSFTSQIGSGQFRLYRGGSGAFFDNEVTDVNGSSTLGVDLGFGNIFHGGVTFFNQNTKNTTRKWVGNNNYLQNGDFQDVSYTNPNNQHAYFKLTGEKTAQDAAMVAKLHDVQPLEVSISGKTANAQFTNASLSKLEKRNRAVNQTVITYLTAEEAAKGAQDLTIKSYPLYDLENFHAPALNQPLPQDTIQRVDNCYHKKHHISEMTVTDRGGKRMVYGIPVYNVKQTEYSFAIGSKNTDYYILNGTNNQVPLALNNANTTSVSINHTKGIDNYSHTQTQPAYASSFLLTSVLSPDYVDRTGDGISDDDPGTAIKFNYSRRPNLFRWRTPFNGATLNRGMLADKDDDKGSIIYGEKELWYTSSIESKTKVAYFITQNRRDAMGVTDFTGSDVDAGNPQKCLKEIRLYSKADMSKPIKVVKFEYTYELCRGVPNNADNVNGIISSDQLKGGKLTLKKVYFEYGNSPKGANYPYQFTYQNSVNSQDVNYSDMVTDRWGVYKSSAENLLPLKNDEFPYTNQDLQNNAPFVKARLDQNAALWHLSAIKLPTGGIINVTYESDDYAYVQNKRAMVMSGLESLIDVNGNDLDSNSTSYLKDAKGFKIKIPNTAVSGDPTTWFKKNYLSGADYIYTKFLVKLATPNSISGGEEYNNDFVPCYSKVKSVTINGNFAMVLLDDRQDGGTTANPIIFSAWQKIKDEYPRYAYPGFDKRTKDGQASVGVADAVKAIFTSIGNLKELTENFYQKAARKNYAAQVKLNRSFVRINKQDGHKLGGGVRVKKIQISDSWQDMTANSKLVNAKYGQAYDYTTIDNGVKISSGVAAYEPSVGNDENALKQPVPYIEKIKGSIDNFFDLEAPFGESFFPAPSVGYSMVTVTDLNKSGDPDPTLRTGYSVSEFYTAKDFPVRVTVMPLSQNENKPQNKLSFLGATSIDERTMTQGYSIELNDMHGKMKATRTFNQSGAEIASTVYYYNAENIGADSYKLTNMVNVVKPDGSVSNNQIIGRDIDFFTDFREFETKNSGQSIDLGADVFAAFFVFAIPHFPKYDNSEYKLFRSACAVKVSQYYGLIDKVVKTENGSSITTSNIAYDGNTGDPIVTSTQNEFDKRIYTVSLPAYWVYKGMGPANQNAGVLLKNFSTNSAGEFINYDSFLKAGDEIVDLATGVRYFVIESQSAGQGNTTKKLISNSGKLAAAFSASQLVKLVRSGYRNMLDASAQSLVCLNNPIQNNQLAIVANSDLTGLKVINASARTFSESWAMPASRLAADSTRVENTSADFSYVQSINSLNYGYFGTHIYRPGSPTDTIVTSAFLKAGLNRSGIWPNPNTTLYLNAPVGFQKDITIAVAGTYYIGYSGDDTYLYSIDGLTLPSTQPNSYWSVYPVNFSAGTHHLTLQATNIPLGSGDDSPANNPGAIGMEIYNCTAAQLYSGAPLSTVFTTAGVIGDHTLQSFLTINGARVDHYLYVKVINPYTAGFLGNWRERSSLVYQQSRYKNKALMGSGMDIKNAGYINDFTSYWYYGSPPEGLVGWQSDNVGNRARWITANTVTSYDRYGQQTENKDALGRYSAARFDFNGELPSGVAANAMNREIYVNGFEDQIFNPGTITGDTLNDFRQTSTGAMIRQFIDSTTAHSGNYSVRLPLGGLILRTMIYSQELRTDSLLEISSTGEYNVKNQIGVYPKGFEPAPNKKYIIDMWVSDGHPYDRSINIVLTRNGLPVSLSCKAVVEGWKLLEGAINLSAMGAGTLTIGILPASNSINVDDVRILPFDSHLKSYVYDDKTMRLMAEIDENGFATFYEYDDEGLLVRVKKETERGVMTIKESRSSYKKTAL
jgi:hypothetical protein